MKVLSRSVQILSVVVLALALTACGGSSNKPVGDLIPPSTSASPAGGGYEGPVAVSLSCDDGAGGSGCAATYYTTDGSDPDTDASVYADALNIETSTVLKYFSVDEAGNEEAVRSAVFTIGDTPAVGPTTVATPPGGVFGAGQSVSLSCTDAQAEPCAAIYFTRDGSQPDENSPVYTAPIQIDASTVLRFFGRDADGLDEPVQTEIYVIDDRGPTTLVSPPGGAYAEAQLVELSCDDNAGVGCAATYYTTDGTDPTTDSTPYSAPIAMDQSGELRVFSVDALGNEEAIQTHGYLIDDMGPSASAEPAGGTFSGPQLVLADCDDGAGAGCAEIHYSLDGQDPDLASATYDRPIVIDASATLKLVAFDSLGNQGPVAGFDFVIDPLPPSTVASPAGGSFSGATSVTLTCDDGSGTGCAATYYTTDGSQPTEASSVYTAPLLLEATTNLRFFSMDQAGNRETAQTELYLIDSDAPATLATPAAGAYDSNLAIALVCDDGAGSGCAATHYTTDGSDPTTASPVYTGPIFISASTSLRFFSIDLAGNEESSQTLEYVIDKLPPSTSASPAGGQYAAAQSVALACDDGAGSGCAAIHFTTDGSDPTTASPVYSAPIAIAANTSLRFFSVDQAGNQEPVQEEIYVIDTAAPSTVAAPAGGTFAQDQLVNLSCDDGSGTGCTATFYTTDGSDPTAASPVYSVPIPITANTTLKFFSRDQVGNDEGIQTEIYQIDKQDPVTSASPAGGQFAAAQSVTLACDDGSGSGCAATYYTTDGSDPTTASTVYGAPVSIPANATLKFFSTDLAGNQEAIRQETYVIDTQAPASSASPAGGTTNHDVVVSLICNDAGGTGCAAIHYTLNGMDPTTASPTYSAPLDLSANVTLKFFAVDQVGNEETINTETYVIDKQDPQTTAAPAGGSYAGAQSVSLSCDDGSGTGCVATHYTTDGSQPTTASPTYAAPIPVNANLTLRFFSVDGAGNQESVRTETYIVDTQAPSTTAFPTGGTYNTDLGITLTCTDGSGSGCATTYYTLDGSVPTTASPVYSGLITITDDTTLNFFSVDQVGNEEAIQTEAYEIDKEAPVSSANPVGGSFNYTFSVSLSCADTGGAGCEAIYYTTDGSQPTTASPQYGSPIPIGNGTTTIRFRARDLAGNLEAVNTEVYVVDVDPPDVSLVDPADGAVRVDIGTSVQIVFDEDMDPLTITDANIQLEDSSGPVTGTLTYDQATHTATLTPDADLAFSETFTLTVTTGVRDLAQNAMAAPFQSTFSTMTEIFQLSSGGAPSVHNSDLAYNASGDGMATWRVDTDGSCHFVYSLYDQATDTWGPEEIFYTTSYCQTADNPFPVESVGDEFMVAWNQSGDINTARFVGGVWQPTETVMSGVNMRYTFNTMVLASNGTDYGIAFPKRDTVNSTWAAIYTGGAWTAPVNIQASSSDVQQPQIAGGDNGFLVVWKTAAGGAYSNYYESGTGWGFEQSLYGYISGWPYAASNGGQFCVAFANGSTAYARIGDGNSFAATEVIETAGSSSIYASGVASNGIGFMVGMYSGGDGHAAIWDGATWDGGQMVIDGVGQFYNSAVAAYGPTYAFLAEVIDFAGDERRMLFNSYAFGAWGPLYQEVDPYAGDAEHPVLAASSSGYGLSWDQDTGTDSRIVFRTFDGATLGAVEQLPLGAYETSAEDPQVATDGAGHALVVWPQAHRGATAIFGSYYDGTAWSAPMEVVYPAGGSPTALAVASNGTDFMVAYNDDGDVYARTYDGAVWGAPTMVSLYSPSSWSQIDLASNGSGYALAFRYSQDIRAAIYHNGAWGADQAIDTWDLDIEDGPHIASNGSSYMVVWTQAFSTNIYSVVAGRAVYDGGSDSWSFEAPGFIENVSLDVTGSALATDGINYMVIFSANKDVYAVGYDGAWGTEAVIDGASSSYTCGYMHLVSDGTGFLAAYRCDRIRTAILDSWGGSWTETLQPESSAIPVAAAGGPPGYSLLWAAGGRLWTKDFGGAWGTAREVSYVPTSISYNDGFDAAFDGSVFLIVWDQLDPVVSTLRRIFARHDY